MTKSITETNTGAPCYSVIMLRNRSELQALHQPDVMSDTAGNKAVGNTIRPHVESFKMTQRR